MQNTTNTSELTDAELVRLDATIYRKMCQDGGGFGIDRPTMKIVHPHLLQWLEAVRLARSLRGI